MSRNASLCLWLRGCNLQPPIPYSWQVSRIGTHHLGPSQSGKMEIAISQRCSMSNVIRRVCTFLVVLGGLGIGACSSPSSPSAIPSGKQAQVAEPGQSSGGFAGLTASVLGTGVNAGWTCIGPPTLPGGFICAPPGLGLPSVPPVPDYGGAPTYNLSAFTLDHQFVHRFKLLRPDLYHGEPCLGGDPWNYIGFLDYYECVIKD
jgi:hypothetical protein